MDFAVLSQADRQQLIGGKCLALGFRKGSKVPPLFCREGNQPFQVHRGIRCSRISPLYFELRRPSEMPDSSSAILAKATRSHNHIPRRLNLAFLDLTCSKRKHLHQCHSLLGLIIAFDVLHHRLGFSILSDNQGPCTARLRRTSAVRAFRQRMGLI